MTCCYLNVHFQGQRVNYITYLSFSVCAFSARYRSDWNHIFLYYVNKGVIFSSPFAQRPKSGLDRLFIKTSRSHTELDTHTVGLLWTSDQPVVGAATYTTNTRQAMYV